jgi:hypothetical protein
MSHTPTPYSMRSNFDTMIRDSQDNQLAFVTYVKTVTGGRRNHEDVLDNAEFIVSACNAHDELVAAIKAVIKYDESDDADGVAMMLNYVDALDKCRAALAKAGAA